MTRKLVGAERVFQKKHWDDVLDRAIKVATLGSVSFLAASSIPNINPTVVNAHPLMIHLFLIGALLFVFCAGARLLSAFFQEQTYSHRMLIYTIRCVVAVGIICFFLGGILAVIYLVF